MQEEDGSNQVRRSNICLVSDLRTSRAIMGWGTDKNPGEALAGQVREVGGLGNEVWLLPPEGRQGRTAKQES